MNIKTKKTNAILLALLIFLLAICALVVTTNYHEAHADGEGDMTFFARSNFAGDTISLGYETKFGIDLYVKNLPSQGITGLDVRVYFDYSAFTYTDRTPSTDTNRFELFNINAANQASGYIIVTSANMSTINMFSGSNGELHLGTVNFTPKNPVAAGNYTFEPRSGNVGSSTGSVSPLQHIKLILTAADVPTEYNITYNLDGGTNHPGNPTKYSSTTLPVTLQNPAKSNHTFGGWFDNAELSGTAVTQISAGSTGDKEFWAKWTPDAPTTHTVSFSVVNGNGSLTATYNSNPFTSGSTVTAGSSVNFTAAPTTGYQVKQWTSGGTVVDGNKTNNYTLSNVQVTTTVTAEFELIPDITYSVTFSITGGNGNITAMSNGTAITSVATVAEGSVIVFTAAPDSGYRVKAWTLNGVPQLSVANTFTINGLAGNVLVTVEFETVPSSTFRITFYDDDDTTVLLETDAALGALITTVAPTPPVKAGKTFARWAGLLPWMTVTGNHAFYAVYVPDSTLPA